MNQPDQQNERIIGSVYDFGIRAFIAKAAEYARSGMAQGAAGNKQLGQLVKAPSVESMQLQPGKMPGAPTAPTAPAAPAVPRPTLVPGMKQPQQLVKPKTLGGNTPATNPIGLMGPLGAQPGKITGTSSFGDTPGRSQTGF